jgi:hypothetical protein
MADSVTNPDLIKIALVPFEGTVNVASSSFNVDAPPSWIDWNDSAQASTSGVNFDKRNSKNVGHRWLFNQLKANDSKIKWAGCVEMRPGPYELSDTAPTGTIADTRYVPYFWPDEPDSGNANGNTYTNNYLNDKGTFTKGTGSNRVQDPVAAQMSLAKYNTVQWQSSPSTIKTDAVASIAGTGTPYQYGPNKGCPRPIVALTNKNGKATIKTAIDQMLAYWATGTYIPAGLVWGWHVLSPTEPYTEGIAPSDPLHSKTLKAMVLLTDGDNDVSPGGTKSNYYTVNQNNNLSRYSGYGYLAKGRLGSSLATAASSLDAKTATLCKT